MRRGTTPTLQITVTGLSKIEIQILHLILEQQGVVIKKTEQDVSIDGEVISATLTQEETLSLTADEEHTHSAADITSGTMSINRLPTITVAKGGTGATTAAQARVNLGVDISAETIQMFEDAGYPIE